MLRRLTIILFAASLPAPANATMGGGHVCSDATGNFRIDYGRGYGEMKTRAAGDDAEHDVRFTPKSQLLLKDIQGYCVSRRCGQRFNVYSRQYLLKAEVEGHGEINLYCEEDWDATPAGCDCDQEETAKRYSLGSWQVQGDTASL